MRDSNEPCGKIERESGKSACILPGLPFYFPIGRMPATEMERQSRGIEVAHGGPIGRMPATEMGGPIGRMPATEMERQSRGIEVGTAAP